MNLDYLEFEQPIVELEEKIEELRRVGSGPQLNLADDISRLETKRDSMIRSTFSSLKPHQIVQLARHPLRPHTADYLPLIFTEFDELHGDRHTDKGKAIIGGLARIDDQPVMVIGQEKGRNTKEKVARNFGMSTPEDFRKALRLMKLAEKFSIPILTFIDTPGAYPGMEAEEHNQSEAIARNLFEMAEMAVPIVCVVIGEGCSGGALAIGVGDCTLMLQYSYYSVISPEGCASILWKSAAEAPTAAEALNLTAERLLELGLIDVVIPEPLGGAHRNIDATAAAVKSEILKQLRVLEKRAPADLLTRRYERLVSVGR